MAGKTSSNTRQKVLLGVLVLVLGYFVLHMFVFSGPKPKNSNRAESATTSSSSRPPGAILQTQSRSEAAARLQARTEAVTDGSPLTLDLLEKLGGGSSEVGNRGNIFAYYRPPPPKPTPPPPPPPITLSHIQPQSAIAGTPKQFTLTVSGKAIPPDARIIIDGRPRVTKRVNDTTLSTDMVPADYPSSRNLNVEIKSASDPKLFSNPFTFVVQPSPEPPFKYVGRIGELGIYELSTTKEVVRLQRGATQGAWRIDAIRDDATDVTHTQYEIRRRVVMQDKGRP
jgi:hypothetical protein